MYGPKHSPNLYVISEMKSLLQKSLRRGLEQQALECWVEIDGAGLGNQAWRTLYTATLEDTGLASISSINMVFDHYRAWQGLMKKYYKGRTGQSYQCEEARALGVEAVSLVCRAPKARLAPSVNGVLMSQQRDPRASWSSPLQARDASRLRSFLQDSSRHVDSPRFDLDRLFRGFLRSFREATEQAWCEENELQTLFYANALLLADGQDHLLRLGLKLVKSVGNHVDPKTLDKIRRRDWGSKASLLVWLTLFEECADRALKGFLVKLFEAVLMDFGSERLKYLLAILAMIRRSSLDLSSNAVLDQGMVEDLARQLYRRLEPSQDGAVLAERRTLEVPGYAIDKHTSRGKGRDTRALLRRYAKSVNIDLSSWGDAEIAKSHGEGIDWSRQSPVTHFFDEGAVLHKVGIEDIYHERCRSFYLEVEREVGVGRAKTKYMAPKLRSRLLEDWSVNESSLPLMKGWIRSSLRDHYEYSSLRDAPLGQRATAKHRKLVRMLPKVVVKGPYDLDKEREKLSLILFRTEVMGDLWKGSIIPLWLATLAENQLALCSANMSAIDPSAWKTKLEKNISRYGEEAIAVIDRESLGLIQASMIAKKDPELFSRQVFFPAFQHLLHRFLIEAPAGDSHLGNVLVRRHPFQVCGLDYEEVRGSYRDDADLIGLLFSKRPNKNTVELLKKGIREHATDLLKQVELIEDTLRWGSYESVCLKYGRGLGDKKARGKRLGLVRARLEAEIAVKR